MDTTRGKVGRPRRPVAAAAVCELRNQGLSFRRIAEQLAFGYGSVRRAYHADYLPSDNGQERPKGLGDLNPISGGAGISQDNVGKVDSSMYPPTHVFQKPRKDEPKFRNRHF